MKRLLLIEDDKGISSALKQALAATYAVDVIDRGLQGIDMASTGKYQLILLDLNLPDAKGLDVCREIRSSGISTPIIIITADSAVLKKISLLDAGANDYITKPFSLGELKARMRVTERLNNPAEPHAQYLYIHDIVLDCFSHQVKRAGTVIELRKKEFMMLECLMLNSGTVVTRQALMHYAWNGNQDPWTNTVDVHIKYLRDKIDRPFTIPLIKTVHGLGYKLEAPRGVADIKTKGVKNEEFTNSSLNRSGQPYSELSTTSCGQ